MRMQHGDINLYYYHDVLTPENVRAASYGTASDSGTIIPEVGDVLNGFPGWTGSEYESITVRVTEVTQIGNGVLAYDVRVTTVKPDATSELARSLLAANAADGLELAADGRSFQPTERPIT